MQSSIWTRSLGNKYICAIPVIFRGRSLRCHKSACFNFNEFEIISCGGGIDSVQLRCSPLPFQQQHFLKQLGKLQYRRSSAAKQELKGAKTVVAD